MRFAIVCKIWCFGADFQHPNPEAHHRKAVFPVFVKIQVK